MREGEVKRARTPVGRLLKIIGPGLIAGVYATLCRRYFGTPLERFCRMVTRQGLGGLPMLLDFFGPRWRDDRTFAQNLSRLETTIFLQPLLVSRLGALAGIALASATFATLHGLGPSVPIFVLSCILGVIMLRTQRLAASWTVHAVHNGLQFLMMYA